MSTQAVIDAKVSKPGSRSRFNAVKHGFCAAMTVLPGEEALAFEAISSPELREMFLACHVLEPQFEHPFQEFRCEIDEAQFANAEPTAVVPLMLIESQEPANIRNESVEAGVTAEDAGGRATEETFGQADGGVGVATVTGFAGET